MCGGKRLQWLSGSWREFQWWVQVLWVGRKAESCGAYAGRSSSDERAHLWDSVIRRGDAFRDSPAVSKLLQANTELVYEVLGLGVLEIVSDLRLLYLVCAVEEPPKADTSLCLPGSVWRRWGQRLVVGSSAVCGPGICRRNSSRQGLDYWTPEKQNLYAMTPFCLVPSWNTPQMPGHLMQSSENLLRYHTWASSARSPVSAATRETVQGDTDVKAIAQMLLLRAGYLVLTSLNFFNFPKSKKILWDEFWGMPPPCCEVGHKGHSAFTPENNIYGLPC